MDTNNYTKGNIMALPKGRSSKKMHSFPEPDYQHTISLYIPATINFIVSGDTITIPAPMELRKEIIQYTAIKLYGMFDKAIINEVQDVQVDFTNEKFSTEQNTVVTAHFATVTKEQITEIWELAVAIRDTLKQATILLTYDNMGWHV